MRTPTVLLLASLAFIRPIQGSAQQDSVAMSEEYYKMGMEIYDFSHRKQATESFVLATKMNPRNAKAQFMAGKSIMLTIQKEESLPYFKRAFKLDPRIDEDILYYIAEAYHYAEKFDSAIHFYDKYNRLLSRSLRLERAVKINTVNRKIFECRNAMVYKAYPSDVTISHLNKNINSEFPDYAPSITADESMMVFTTRRPEDNSNDRIALDHESYEEIYVSNKVNGEWQPAKNIGPPLNTDYHNANVNISGDGKEMLTYHDSNGGDLFMSYLTPGGTWSSPAAMKEINSEYLENSATISKDGKVLYFTSDRPGGYGRTDIYSCRLDKKGHWTGITNLGPDINTELDEDGVFISANGKHLYFSSNGHAGMGDLDLYRSTYDSTKQAWSEPVNLGYPINSVENDIYFVLTSDERYAYISSVRKENIGEQDIYKVDMKNWKPVDLGQAEFIDAFVDAEVKKQPAVFNTRLDILTIDDATGEPVASTLQLMRRHRDTLQIPNRSKGLFAVPMKMNHDSDEVYEVVVTAPGYVTYTSSVYFLGSQTKNLVISDTIRLKTPVLNINLPLNIYFQTNSDVLISFDELRRIMEVLKETPPSMQVEISGHTDDSGDAVYNQDLSQRRAEAVKRYLIKAGVDGNRINAVGYGETSPIASNLTYEGRRLNRRTELKVTAPKNN